MNLVRRDEEQKAHGLSFLNITGMANEISSVLIKTGKIGFQNRMRGLEV